MPFIPLQLETKSKPLRSIFSIPLVGGLIYLVLMIMVVAFPIVPICMVCGMPEEHIPKVLMFAVALFDLFLRRYETKLSILFIPAWVMLTFTGILACFGVLK